MTGDQFSQENNFEAAVERFWSPGGVDRILQLMNSKKKIEVSQIEIHEYLNFSFKHLKNNI